MPLTFYPHSDDLQKGSLEVRIEVLSEAAERFKALVLDPAFTITATGGNGEEGKKRMVPRDQTASYNWEEIARVMKEVREMTEANKADRLRKANHLTKLAEVYEVLRGAKMAKLEAVRLALISEANQLRGSASQVA